MSVLYTPSTFAAYPWMEYAFLAMSYNIREDRNERQQRAADNPYIVDFLRYAQVSGQHLIDETAWCAAFVNWCMHNAGMEITGNPRARYWASWGRALGNPVFGCVSVFRRGGGGHVGFYVGPGQRRGNLAILGGNQRDPSGGSINVRDYPVARLLAYRWPMDFPIPT